MIISKKRFTELCDRLDNLERVVSGLPEDYNDKLSAFAEDLNALSVKLKDFDAFHEMTEEERRTEKSFLQGFQNIMNFKA